MRKNLCDVEGMRKEDAIIFHDYAMEARNRMWILVRHTNKYSLDYIGKTGYYPKPIGCKAKTADRKSRRTCKGSSPIRSTTWTPSRISTRPSTIGRYLQPSTISSRIANISS